MNDMPRPRFPNLHRQIANGRTVWYVRKGKGPRTRIRAAYGSPEFRAEYDAAIAGTPISERGKPSVASLAWLWMRYRESTDWKSLSMATRRQRENIMKHVINANGDLAYADVTKKKIVEGRDRRSDTPAMARHFVNAMRKLFDWAVEADYVKENPADRVSAPKPKTNGHPVWTVDEIRLFIKKWPVGTRERLAFDLVFCTGLRRGDIVKLGRQHVGNGVISFNTGKTGTPVKFPMLSPLAKSIEATPSNNLTFFVSEFGNPMTKESFGNWFGKVCKKTGVKGTAHGVRKALSTLLAEHGATGKELDAVFAWEDPKTSAIYTRTADRGKLATALFNRVNVEQILDSLSPHSGESEGIVLDLQAKSKP